MLSVFYTRKLCELQEQGIIAEVSRASAGVGLTEPARRKRIAKTLRCRDRICPKNLSALAALAVPEYVLLACPKCASSSLHNILQAHPCLTTGSKHVDFYLSPWHTKSEHRGAPLLVYAHQYVLRDSVDWSNTNFTEGFGKDRFEADAWSYICILQGAYREMHDRRDHVKIPLSNREGRCYSHSSDGDLGRQHHPLIGDHNPHNLFANSSIISLVARFASPSLRLVVFLCDPTKRAFSSYRYMHFQHGMIYTNQASTFDRHATFKEVVDAQLRQIPSGLRTLNPWNYRDGCDDFDAIVKNSVFTAIPESGSAGPVGTCFEFDLDGVDAFGLQTFVWQGMYALALTRWLRHFPRERFHIATLEEFIQNSSSVIAGIERFLGLPFATYALSGIFDYHRNENLDGRNDTVGLDAGPEVFARLRNFYAPHNHWLEQVLGLTPGAFAEWNGHQS